MTATNSLFKEPMFVVPFKTSHGDTMAVRDPRREAMKDSLMAVLSGRGSKVVENEDGSWTVKSTGCSDITYVTKKWKETK
jgi:hypothetical protein